MGGDRADSGCGRVDGRAGYERGGEAGSGEGELGGDVCGDVAGYGGEAGLSAALQDGLSALRARRRYGERVRGQFPQCDGPVVASAGRGDDEQGIVEQA